MWLEVACKVDSKPKPAWTGQNHLQRTARTRATTQVYIQQNRCIAILVLVTHNYAYYKSSSKTWYLLHCCFTKAHFASDNISRGRYASSRCSRVFYIFHRMVEPYPTLQWAMLDVTEHFWPKIWSHFRPYCLSLHSLTVSFSSESQMIFSHFFQNFVGLLQDYFLSITVLMLIPIISYIAQGQCFNFLLWN